MNLFKLNDYNRHASLGYDYNYLRDIYPTWSDELHMFGNELENKKLEKIAVHGLITWYLNNNFDYDINYDFNKNVNDVIQDIKNLSFYNFTKIIKFSSIYEKLKKNIENSKGNKYRFLMFCFPYSNSDKKSKNKFLFEKYCMVPFYKYLIEVEFENNQDRYNMFLEEIRENISKLKISNNILTTFLETYPFIKVWGIIFQKFKVILEKSTQGQKVYIYKLDKFVETLQQHIYTLVYMFSMYDDNLINVESKFTNYLKDSRFLEYYDLKNLESFNKVDRLLQNINL